MKIKWEVCQGHSFFLLLFCLVLVHLSYEPSNMGYGYNIYGEKAIHLFYIDDLKLYAKNVHRLYGLLKTVKTFSDNIGITFSLDKCAKLTFIRGKLNVIALLY